MSIGAAFRVRNCAALSGSLDPIDVPFGALFEKGHDPDAGFANAPPQLLQLRLEKFVLGPLYDLGDARLQARSSAPEIVSGTKSGSRTRTSRPFRKSQRSSIARKNRSTSSTTAAASVTPAASRVTVKRPLRVRAL